VDNRSVRLGGDARQSIIVTGDGNTVTFVIGETLRLPLWRRQFRAPDRRRRQRQGEPRHELDLLLPDADVLPFVGRDPLMAELQAWLDAGVDVSAHALTGGAGSGKTRVALELCRLIDSERVPDGEAGWLGGFLKASEVAAWVEALATRDWSWAKDTLVVVDNAAGVYRELARWLDRLAVSPENAHKLRLLLLDREAPEGFGWWHELTRPGLEAEQGRVDLFWGESLRPREVEPLTAREQRRALLAAAADAELPDEPQLLAQLDAPRFGNPLHLGLAGLVAREHGFAVGLSMRQLAAARHLAARELDRLERLGASVNLPEPTMRHAVAFNGLAGGLPIATVEQDLADECQAAHLGGDVRALAELLQQELPPVVGEAETPRLATIQPDFVGEAVVVEALAAPPSVAHAAPDLVRRAYTLTGARAAEALVHLVQDFGWAVEDAQAEDEERKAGQATLMWLTRLAAGVDDLDALEPLALALPQETMVLRETAVAITERLAEATRAAASADDAAKDDAACARYALWVGNLATRYSALGRHEDALQAGEESVELYRHLAKTGHASLSDLARALNNLGLIFGNLGRREAAFQASAEAVGVYRRLAKTKPDAFRADLATALHNLGGALANLGGGEDALQATKEALAIRRGLAETRPDAFRPRLAQTLDNLSLILSALGRREDALQASEEAVGLCRRLAETRPDAFRAHLANALHNLGLILSNLGRIEDALQAGEEAAGLYRVLAENRPDAFNRQLATALNNLSGMLSNLGRHADALQAIEEAVARHRRLAETWPDAFRLDLAAALRNLGLILSNLARHEDALQASEEAVGLCRRLAETRPDASLLLASSLVTQGAIYRAAGDATAAAASFSEGIAALAEPFRRMPAPFASPMMDLVRNYLGACEESATEPDKEFLEPIMAALQPFFQPPGDDDDSR